LFNWLDYCVTHSCGITHNFGWQDALWMIYPLVSMAGIIFIGFYLIVKDLDKYAEKKKVN
jgi:hypothetical protein